MPGAGDAQTRFGLELQMRGRQLGAQRGHTQNLAEMGAARLERLGPQGQQWAQMLRQNPSAAAQMADQYGGFGAIEQGLMSAQAQGRSERALRESLSDRLSPAELEVFMQRGHAGLQELRATSKHNRVWGSGGGASGGQIGPEEMKLRFAYESEDPAKIQAVQDRARYGSGWKHSDLRAEQNDFEKRLLPFDDLESQLISMESLDPEVPLDILQMVNMFQRNIDEGIVRGEDVKLQQFATMSGWETFKAKAISMVDSNEAIPTEMGRKLKTSLLRQLRDKSIAMNMIVEDIEDYADANKWGDAERAVAIPRRLQALKNIGRATTSVEAKSDVIPNGTESIDEATGRTIVKVTGGWNFVD